jgi:ORF6N domain
MLVDIEKKIYIVRGMRVMLDADLAELYGTETKRLNEQVRRNLDRFPSDFMFQLNNQELMILRSQIATSELKDQTRYNPYAFSENGVAMLSSVLNSPQAIQVNIAIMRIFTKMRSFLMLEEQLNSRVTKLEEGTNKMFQVVFERLDSIEDLKPPKLSDRKKKIGF